MKSPVVDGFNTYFYKKTWRIIEKAMYEVVQELFQNYKMLKAIHDNLITLVPKTSNPKLLRDFRPIVYRSIVYKVISKLSLIEIKGVIEGVVG